MIRDAAIYLLNHLVLAPSGWATFDEGFPLDDADAVHTVPASSGVYALYVPGHFFGYPGGHSQVLYIGKASGRQGLREKISSHSSYAERIRTGQLDRGRPRHEWAATYWPLVTYCVAPEGNDAATMETDLIRTFADAFRIAPVANNQSSW